MTLLEINTLGCLQLYSNKAMFSGFPTRQVKVLFIFLILNPEVQHSRIKIISLLWPEVTEKKGRNCLNTTLWRLRIILKQIHVDPQLFIHTSREYVSLLLGDAIMLDFENFQQFVSQADRIEDVVQKESLLRKAVDLYKGAFCEDIYEDWCLVERERLSRLFLKALGQLMHCVMKRNAFDEAIDFGRRILQADPLREEVHRALMICYRQLGLHVQALEQYRSYAQQLAEELNIMPLQETIKLYDQILTERFLTRDLDMPLSGNRSQTELRDTYLHFQVVSERLQRLLDLQEVALK